MFSQSEETIPTRYELAEFLKISESTLNRRLKRFGTSYGNLKAHYRFTLAKYYLCDPSLSIGHISELLGYQDADTFFKSFKKWSGQTPGQYRFGIKLS